MGMGQGIVRRGEYRQASARSSTATQGRADQVDNCRMMKQLVAFLLEFSAVVVSSLTIGTGIAFLQNLTAHRLSFKELSESPLLLDGAHVGGVMAVSVGCLAYYIALRKRLTIRAAAILLIGAVPVSIIGGHLFSWASIIVTSLATFLLALCFLDWDPHSVGPHGTFWELLAVLISSLVLGLGLGVWIGGFSFDSIKEQQVAAAVWGGIGCAFGLLLYYAIMRRKATVGQVSILLAVAWISGLAAVYILGPEAGWSTLITTVLTTLVVAIYLMTCN